MSEKTQKVCFLCPESVTDSATVDLALAEYEGWSVCNPLSIKDPKERTAALVSCDRCVFVTFPREHEAPGVPIEKNRPRVSHDISQLVQHFIKARSAKRVFWVTPDHLGQRKMRSRFLTWRGFIRLNAVQTAALVQAYKKEE